MIKKFFECFADYARKENDLSDVTVALCKANPRFKKLFIEFFFKDMNYNEIKDIKREVPSKDGGSRVDIMIEMHRDEKPYLIEVKKYDENHHFKQYVKAYDIPEERLGYIANYQLNQKGNYVTKQWKEFFEEIKAQTEKDELIRQDELIQGYAEYLNKTCYITYDKRIDLYNTESDDDFRRIFEDIVSIKEIQVKYYKKYQQNYAYGFFFSKPNEIIDTENGGFGVFYFQPGNNPEISIVIHSRNEFEKRILSNILDDGNYYLAPDRKEILNASSVVFRLKDTHMKNIVEGETYKIQHDILQSFYGEVIGKIIKYI